MESIRAIVETPRGSANQYEYDQDRRTFRLRRHLRVAMVHPAEFGFIPGTLDDTGGPLHALILSEHPTFPGCEVDVKVLGMCVVTNEHGRARKLLCVPTYDATWTSATDITDIPKTQLDTIDHFFARCEELDESDGAYVGQWRGRAKGIEVLTVARQRLTQ